MSQGPVLRDIHLPAEPSWWWPAPGWWLLAAFIAIALAFAWRAFAQRRRRGRLQRALREELALLRREHPEAAAQVAAMSLLLRRAAKRYAPAALTLRDEAWLAFLDGDEPARPFSQGAGRLLLDGPYRARVEAGDADALAALVEQRLAGFVATSPRKRASRGALPAARPGANARVRTDARLRPDARVGTDARLRTDDAEVQP